MTAKEFVKKNLGKSVNLQKMGEDVEIYGMIVGYTNDNSVILSFSGNYGWKKEWLKEDYDTLLIKSPLNVRFIYMGVNDFNIIQL